MDSRKGNIPHRRIRLAIVLCIVVISLLPLGITLARYFTQMQNNANVSAAVFSPSLSSEDDIDISGITKPGMGAESTFKVQNYLLGNVSEIKMQYKIIIKTTGNLPLTFTLLDGETVLGEWDCDGSGGAKEYAYEDPLFVFDAGVAQSHDYAIRVQWPTDRNDARFSGRTDAVYVSVEWAQTA